MNSISSIITQMRENGMDIIHNLDNKTLLDFILSANDTYREGQPFLTDAEYDTIVSLAYSKKGMKTKLDKIVGAPVANERKTKLPYFMGSMNKIKPDTNSVVEWLTKYPEPYVFSAKLDGVSGLYMVKNGEAKLYTRGNGSIGQDISFLLPQFNLPFIEGAVIRGEFLISKEVFKQKWEDKFSNSRNLVSGLINAKRQPSEKYKDLKFVAYEVIEPIMMPSMGFEYLRDKGFDTVKHGQILMSSNLTNDVLSKILVQWRHTLPYEIDGVIVTSDHIYSRKNENPKHSFAFKMVLSDQMVEAHVVDVVWAASKDGYLKPRVKIIPVTIGGATIEYATGFNAAFIKEHKIGAGAIISLIRSGDVIPHIQNVIQPAKESLFPTVPYLWNDTNVDIYVDTSKMTDTDSHFTKQILVKNLTYFFSGLGVQYLSIGNTTNLVNNEYNTVGKIIRMKPDDFVEIEGMGRIIGEKITKSINEAFKKATLIDIMIHSNQFGRSIGAKKIQLIMKHYPTIITNNETVEDKITKICELNGFAYKTASEFVEAIPNFLIWLKHENMEYFLQPNYNLSQATHKDNEIKNQKIVGRTFVFTGFRNKELDEYIYKNDGIVTTSLTKQTSMLVYIPGCKGGKLEKAKSLHINIKTLDEFQSWLLQK